MNRANFLAQLRAGLSGLHQSDINDVIADYESISPTASPTDARRMKSPLRWAIRHGWRANCAPRSASSAGSRSAAPATSSAWCWR